MGIFATSNVYKMKYNLSEILEVIENRRTIRPEQFSERKVHKEIVAMMMDAARWAPTHRFTQPWRFKAFMGESLLQFGKDHAEMYKQSVDKENFDQKKYDKLVSRAEVSSAVIAICMKRDEKHSVPEVEEVLAVGCAVQNMHLVGTAYGIGCYWNTGGMTFSKEMHDYLNLGTEDKVLGLYYVGYPAIDWPKGQRRPLEYYTEWRE